MYNEEKNVKGFETSELDQFEMLEKSQEKLQKGIEKSLKKKMKKLFEDINKVATILKIDKKSNLLHAQVLLILAKLGYTLNEYQEKELSQEIKRAISPTFIWVQNWIFKNHKFLKFD